MGPPSSKAARSRIIATGNAPHRRDVDLVIQKTMQDGQLTVAMYDSSMSPKTNVNSWDLIYVSMWDWLRMDLEYEMKQRQVGGEE